MTNPHTMDPLTLLSVEWQPIGDGHQGWAGWAEDGYAWSCTCGAAGEHGFGDLDSATIANLEHLIWADAIRPVTIEEAYT